MRKVVDQSSWKSKEAQLAPRRASDVMAKCFPKNMIDKAGGLCFLIGSYLMISELFDEESTQTGSAAG